MVERETKGMITFGYDTSNLFNESSLISAYMSKSIADTGVDIDKLVLTEDEEEVYKVCLRNALSNTYEHILKLASGELIDEGSRIEISIKDNKAYKENAVEMADKAIRDCLIYGSLMEFYSVVINVDIYRLAQKNFNENLAKLKKMLFHLSKKRTFPLT